jgi:hypothetical protein
MSFAALMHLADGLCLSALHVLKVETYLICLVDTRIPTAPLMEWQFILPLKHS